jgi:hypothetical protein
VPAAIVEKIAMPIVPPSISVALTPTAASSTRRPG